MCIMYRGGNQLFTSMRAKILYNYVSGHRQSCIMVKDTIIHVMCVYDKTYICTSRQHLSTKLMMHVLRDVTAIVTQA